LSPSSDHSFSRQAFHPVLEAWFHHTFGEPTDVQLQAWHSIQQDKHTLIAAPTGSGKTLAALLPGLDKLAKAKSDSSASWEPGVRILYVTPLKALNNDIHQHLTDFIAAIDQYAAEHQSLKPTDTWQPIQSAVRTGDTLASERARILRRPPDVLITTPESLYLMLTSEKGRGILRTIWTVIVDEIHGLAGDKRGAHLSLSLERLSACCSHPVQRIGVSATQKPLELVARFLGGWEETTISQEESNRTAPRSVQIIESSMNKTTQVRVTLPDFSQPVNNREGIWTPLLEQLMQLMADKQSVLLFVNSRRLCERLVLRLNDYNSYEFARAHHGSLARERRLEVEQMLKAGQLRCLVATSSLELGIDVGHIDLVLQVDPPPDAASGIQRIGRAGHAVGDISRGFIITRSRSQLPEAAILCRNIVQRNIAPIRLPYQPLDVLSQQITAIVAAGEITVTELHRLVRGSECYRSLPLDQLIAVLSVLAGFFPFARPLLDWNRESGMLSKRANTSVAAVTGVGTIPQTSAYPVHHANSRIHLGELDEEFVQESRIGDVFQLGTTSWMITRIEQDRIYVNEAPNRFSEIPFWRNEPGGRSPEVGAQIGHLIRQLEERLGLDRNDGDLSHARQPLIEWLDVQFGLEALAAGELLDLIIAQHRAAALPTDQHIVIEHYQDLTNQRRIIIHNPFGRTLNRTWLLAIERQFEKLFPYSLYGNAKDNGIELVCAEWDDSWLQTIWHITSASVDSLLNEAISGSPLLAISFRRIAETSLLLSRSFTRTPLWQKRLRSEELLKQALPYAEQFPYLQEAFRESLHTYLDVAGLKQLLTQITEGHIQIVVHETRGPSPFAAQFIADYVNMQIYEGDGFSDATRLQLLQVSKSAASELFGEAVVAQAVDPEIIQLETARLMQPPRSITSADELYTQLKTRGELTIEELNALAGDHIQVAAWLTELELERRIATITYNEDSSSSAPTYWICSDEMAMYDEYPGSDRAIDFVAGRYALHRLSFTDEELLHRYQLSSQEAVHVVERLLAMDRIEQAPFARDKFERLWTSRQVAKRLSRLTIEKARKMAAPIDPVRWCAQMALMQHALPGTQLGGMEGLRAIIERLQGFFLPASHWESIIFPARMDHYRKEELDLLCASGEIIWLGKKAPGEKEGRVAFFLAEAKPLYMPYLNQDSSKGSEETKHPQLLKLLQTSGASFLTRLSRETGKVPSELLADLLDLVWEGHVTNDQFAPLRLQLQTKGKQLARTGSGQGRWYWTGSLNDSSYGEVAAPLTEPEAASGSMLSATGADVSPSTLHWAQHLLDSCGIISKELVAQYAPFNWDELLPVLRQLEHWGVVTRGLLVQHTSALQFARREVISAVRQPLSLPQQNNDEDIMVLSAVDLANPFGLTAEWPDVPGASFARKSGNFIVLHRGVWRYWVENSGRKITVLPDAEENSTGKSTIHIQYALLKPVFRAIMKRQSLRKIKIERWNGEDIALSSAAEHLLELGAERDNRSLVLWPSQLQ